MATKISAKSRAAQRRAVITDGLPCSGERRQWDAGWMRGRGKGMTGSASRDGDTRLKGPNERFRSGPSIPQGTPAGSTSSRYHAVQGARPRIEAHARETVALDPLPSECGERQHHQLLFEPLLRG